VLKLIVGLGNPGPEHAKNRHNVGFQIVERVAAAHGMAFTRMQLKARLAKGEIAGQPVTLAKPMTYMNASGDSVGPLARWLKLDLADLLVIYDDLDLPLGQIRLRARGGHAGHKGMMSIVENLGSQEFARLRVGIGRPVSGDEIEYVLSDFTRDEEAIMVATYATAVAAVECWVCEGILMAMNRFNVRIANGELRIANGE